MTTLPIEPPASSAESHRRSPIRRQAALLAPLLLLVIYPLSLGPALKLAELGIIPFRVLAIYEPLTSLCDHCPPVRHFFDWYVQDVWHWSAPAR